MPTSKMKSEPKASASGTSKSASAKSKSDSTAGRKKSASGNSKSQSTTNHDDIRAWVEKRGGTPATVKGTEAKDNAGLLRIDFPGYSGKDTLEAISWDEFFSKFDESNLQFLYQEKTAKGQESRFNKFVSKE